MSSHQLNYVILLGQMWKGFLDFSVMQIKEVDSRLFAATVGIVLLLVAVPPAWITALDFLCCRSSDEAPAKNCSSSWPAAQTAQQPWRQPLLQPAKCEFKVPIKAFVWLCLVPHDNTIKPTCARPWSPTPTLLCLLSWTCAYALYLLLSCQDVCLHGE